MRSERYFMNTMLKTETDIEGRAFEDLLDICFENAAYFSLTKNTWSDRQTVLNSEFYNMLGPYLCGDIFAPHWFCQYSKGQYINEVFIFRADPKAKHVLLKFQDRLLGNRTEKSIGESLYDLCFFNGGKLFLGTVSHEMICRVYPFSGEFADEVRKLGAWTEEEPRLSEQIELRFFKKQDGLCGMYWAIEAICASPRVYLRNVSMESLSYFLDGYAARDSASGGDCAKLIFGFQEYVEKQFSFDQGTWWQILEILFPRGELCFKIFKNLFDEYLTEADAFVPEPC